MLAPNRLRLSAAAGGVLFIAGYLIIAMVPGGGDVQDSDFTKFYDSDGRMLAAMLAEVALVFASIVLAWFYIELRAATGAGVLTQLGTTLGTVGAILVPVGGAILFGPAGVQQNSDAGFVGVPIAHTFSQAGLGVSLLMGMGLTAVATIMLSVAMRRAGLIPAWLRIVGIVLGVITLGSYIWVPGFAFPIWLTVLAAVGLKSGESR